MTRRVQFGQHWQLQDKINLRWGEGEEGQSQSANISGASVFNFLLNFRNQNPAIINDEMNCSNLSKLLVIIANKQTNEGNIWIIKGLKRTDLDLKKEFK